jgi:hypothetical protein
VDVQRRGGDHEDDRVDCDHSAGVYLTSLQKGGGQDVLS